MRRAWPALAALALACSGGEAAPGPGPQRNNLILVSIDTLRADRLGAYGYDRPTSPALDALAASGVRFETVIAESNWTLPSHMTLFTGLPPGLHGVTLPTHKLSANRVTLAQVLADAGFRTFGITGGGFVEARFGFARGFERYHLRPLPFAEALALTMRVLKRLGPDERFFVFLHTYEVHCPYTPPEPYASRFQTRPPRDHVETEGRCGEPHYAAMGLDEGQAAFLSDRYDATIRYVDDQMAEFLRQLEEAGLREDTILSVLSDHGEEFLEHGRIGHRDTLYIESLRVPWILAGPGLEPRVVRAPVGLVDVMPTLLDLLGVEAPPTAGTSLAPWILGGEGAPPARTLFSETGEEEKLRSAVAGPYHLIVDAKAKRQRFFDWRGDPKEQSDLIGSEADAAAAIRRELVAHAREMTAEARGHATPTARGPTPEEREHLRALGYVE